MRAAPRGHSAQTRNLRRLLASVPRWTNGPARFRRHRMRPPLRLVLQYPQRRQASRCAAARTKALLSSQETWQEIRTACLRGTSGTWCCCRGGGGNYWPTGRRRHACAQSGPPSGHSSLVSTQIWTACLRGASGTWCCCRGGGGNYWPTGRRRHACAQSGPPSGHSRLVPTVLPKNAATSVG